MALHKITLALPSIARPFGAGGHERESEAAWTPNTDAFLTEEGLVVKVELAGMRKEDLELTVEQNQLRITGVRHDGCRAGPCQFVVMEINYGPFEALIEVPAGYDLSHARAAYQNGFLRIDVPRASVPASSPFAVPIETGES